MVRVENKFLKAAFLKQLAMQCFLSSCAVCRENRELKLEKEIHDRVIESAKLENERIQKLR